MRTVFLLLILVSSLALRAQTALPLGFTDYSPRMDFGNSRHFADSTTGKKWFFSKYAGISTGYSFYNGINGPFLAVPLGLQLNRKLTSNLYAFGGLTVAPAYMNFNRSFLTSNLNKFYPNSGFPQSGNLGLYSVASLGLMYINDAKTFSFSGSFSVQNSSYPQFPGQQTRATRKTFVPAGR